MNHKNMMLFKENYLALCLSEREKSLSKIIQHRIEPHSHKHCHIFLKFQRLAGQ